MTDALDGLLHAARQRRAALVVRLRAEGTDCWREFHGTVEGAPGVAVDRYGALLLVQLFRSADPSLEVGHLRAVVAATAGEGDRVVIVDRRGGPAHVAVHGAHADEDFVVHEAGMPALVRARHHGQDPWLFLDLRAGRRRIRELAPGRSVLNLFAYTCTAGLAAACAGAREVWNVDFSAGWLAVGERNLALCGVNPGRVRFLREDCLAVLRQLAGIPLARFGKGPRVTRIEPRTFDLVILDPPRLAQGRIGKVDLVHDYQSLFKPAWLSTASRGAMLATNNVASVDAEDWLKSLTRCAEKAGQPVVSAELIAPDDDFPSPDGRAPLKLALLRK